MDDPAARQSAQWLAKAESDLASAKILLFGAEKHLDTGLYHCQQAVEKTLKAFLASHNEPLIKTHDLEALVYDCINYIKTRIIPQ